MKLYYDPVSTTCRGVLLFAAEHGVVFESQLVSLMAGENHAPAFTAINPNACVPVLEDGDFRLTESSAILRYLAETLGSRTYPADLRQRARVNAAMDWFNTAFYAYYGYLHVYPQVLPKLTFQPTTRAEVMRIGHEGAAKFLDVLDRRMIGDNAFVCGPQISLADYMGLSIVALGELVEFDLSAWPNVVRWKAAMQARPAWKAIDVGFQGWRAALQNSRLEPA